MIILAGGEGKRMCSSIPKVLHKVQGVPMLERVVRNVESLNPSGIFIVSGNNSERFKDALSGYSNVQFIPQLNPQGTGHAVRMVLPYLQDGPVLIVNGDTPLIGDALNDMVKMSLPPCVMVSKIDDPFGQGRIVMDIDGNFQKIVEEKDATDEEKQIKVVNTGIYLVDAQDLKDIVPGLSNYNAQNEYYLTDVFGVLNKRVNLHILPRTKQHQILNVNTPIDLEKANALWQG